MSVRESTRGRDLGRQDLAGGGSLSSAQAPVQGAQQPAQFLADRYGFALQGGAGGVELIALTKKLLQMPIQILDACPAGVGFELMVHQPPAARAGQESSLRRP